MPRMRLTARKRVPLNHPQIFRFNLPAQESLTKSESDGSSVERSPQVPPLPSRSSSASVDVNPVLAEPEEDPEEDPVVGSVQEVVANPALVRSVGKTVEAVKTGRVPISQMEPGEARVMRIIEEAKQEVGIETDADGRQRIVHRQIRATASVSATSRAPAGGMIQAVPHHVYAALGRDCDFLRGQNAEIRRLMDVLLQERRVPVEDSEARSRIGAIEHIARQRLAEFPSTSEWDVEARRVTRLICWILSELRAVRGPRK
ncbi:uncharacterized protein LOC135151673 [Daucus carota subsp. sativus]